MNEYPNIIMHDVLSPLVTNAEYIYHSAKRKVTWLHHEQTLNTPEYQEVPIMVNEQYQYYQGKITCTTYIATNIPIIGVFRLIFQE